MRRARLVVMLAGALLVAPSSRAHAQADGGWRAVDFTRQLRDTLPQRIQVQYEAGRIELRSSSDPLLYAMHLRYDEGRSVPLHRYDAEQRSAVLGVETRQGVARAASSRDGEGSGELRLALPRSVPLDLEIELGGAQAQLDLGGLALQSLRMECGAADAKLSFSTPNRARLRELDISAGAADLFVTQLANANAEQIRIRGGIGVVDLDFGGTWTRDLTVSTRLAVGKLVLRIPPDVGVRVEVQRVAAGFDHEGLVKRDDAWYSTNWERAPHKLHVRAATSFGSIDVQRAAR